MRPRTKIRRFVGEEIRLCSFSSVVSGDLTGIPIIMRWQDERVDNFNCDLIAARGK
jgi:hypothetical protein